MSSSFKVILDKNIDDPICVSLTGIYDRNGKPYCVYKSIRIWRIASGAWYKPNGMGRYVMISKPLHAALDSYIRQNNIKTEYGTHFYPWKRIKVDFIEEITK